MAAPMARRRQRLFHVRGVLGGQQPFGLKIDDHLPIDPGLDLKVVRSTFQIGDPLVVLGALCDQRIDLALQFLRITVHDRQYARLPATQVGQTGFPHGRTRGVVTFAAQ